MSSTLKAARDTFLVLIGLGLLLLAATHLAGCGAAVPMCEDAGACGDAGEPRVPVEEVCAVIVDDLGCSFACAPEGVTCSLPRAVACLEAARSWEDPCEALSRDPACTPDEVCDPW